MIGIEIDKKINKILLYTDDPSVKCLLEFRRYETDYIPWKKQYGKIEKLDKIYENRLSSSNGIFKFVIGLGWAAYIANVFRSDMTPEAFNILAGLIMADTYRTIPFPNLRDHQNDDILHLLKYRIGLFSCYTGYGKTELIATLVNYAYTELGKSVILIAPGKKAKDELVKRCKSRFGLEIPSADGRLDCMITGGILNQKKYKNPELLALEELRFASFDWVLVDEVEYTINPGGEFLFSRLTGASNFYGFSGTADKAEGKMISFANGIDEIVARNKDLIKYFGPSLVYRLPLHLDIDDILISTISLNTLKFDKSEFDQDTNVYLTVMNKIWTHPEVCKTIVKVAKRFPKLFIPINNLNFIISEWIDNYFLGVFRILLICGEGYIYYDLAGNRTPLTLEEACEYVGQGLVDIIPSTSSGFRALDLPNLESTLLIAGNVGGSVLQAAGRVARSKHMNIISLTPKIPTRIPVYSKGMKERDDLIKEYYKYCNMKRSIIDEDNL